MVSNVVLAENIKKDSLTMQTETMYFVAAFYKFTKIQNTENMQQDVKHLGEQFHIKGVFLIAEEGINATIASSDEQSLHFFLEKVQRKFYFTNADVKFSTSKTQPFTKWRVRKKKEIVSLGVEDVDPNRCVGTYIKPKDWNDFIQNDDVVVIDVRNDYECVLGTFEGAVNPQTDTFREFPQFVHEQLLGMKEKKIAMFCTGGIRCEKATSYLIQQGISPNNVFHLEGGILKYLEEVSKEESTYSGECFLFDRRISVVHGIKQGNIDDGLAKICYACSYPLLLDDLQSEHYIEGVSCHRCYDKFTEEQKNRFRERQRQFNRAGDSHFTSNNEPSE